MLIPKSRILCVKYHSHAMPNGLYTFHFYIKGVSLSPSLNTNSRMALNVCLKFGTVNKTSLKTF